MSWPGDMRAVLTAAVALLAVATTAAATFVLPG